MRDGHLNKCKTCTKKDSALIEKNKRSTELGISLERERGRLKYHRLNYREKNKPSYDAKKKTMDNYKLKYPEKGIAKLRSQSIKKQFKDTHLHHWSYNVVHARDVIELSIEDHFLLHRHIQYDQERFMYRDCSTGTLLDTRDSHIEKLNEIKKSNGYNTKNTISVS